MASHLQSNNSRWGYGVSLFHLPAQSSFAVNQSRAVSSDSHKTNNVVCARTEERVSVPSENGTIQECSCLFLTVSNKVLPAGVQWSYLRHHLWSQTGSPRMQTFSDTNAASSCSTRQFWGAGRPYGALATDTTCTVGFCTMPGRAALN
jgi:hypothetical protein